MKLNIKPFNELTSTELYEILRLRQQVFVVEQNCPYLDCDLQDYNSFHLMLLNPEHRLTAYCRIISIATNPDEVIISRVLTEPGFRNKGYARLIMTEALNFIRDTFGKVLVTLGAQSYLISFYESLGFTAFESYLEDGIPHTLMKLKI